MSLEQLIKSLDSVEYRQGFVEGHAKDTIAFQIKQLRKAEGWDQKKLAEVAFGRPALQPMVSRYENPDYGKYSITTLLELAAAFDVALVVRFAPFSELVEWDVYSTEKTLRPPKYSQDVALSRMAACDQKRPPVDILGPMKLDADRSTGFLGRGKPTDGHQGSKEGAA
jgi:transcriptional regulator with XRE-family HTH domain